MVEWSRKGDLLTRQEYWSAVAQFARDYNDPTAYNEFILAYGWRPIFAYSKDIFDAGDNFGSPGGYSGMLVAIEEAQLAGENPAAAVLNVIAEYAFARDISAS